jgi:hypothetical protein
MAIFVSASCACHASARGAVIGMPWRLLSGVWHGLGCTQFVPDIRLDQITMGAGKDNVNLLSTACPLPLSRASKTRSPSVIAIPFGA